MELYICGVVELWNDEVVYVCMCGCVEWLSCLVVELCSC